MSITDELRKWARQFRRIWVDPHSGDLTYITNEHACPPSLDAVRLEDYITAIADRIDERVTELLRKQDADLRAEFDLMNDGWVRLPVDADGEVIHVGDTVRWGDAGEPFEVKAIIYRAGCETEVGDGEQYGEVVAIGCHHYHAPTVEDVLREFANRWWTLPREESADELLADFAKRLQLREDE